MKRRCGWALTGDLERTYHDLEWGVPVHDDRRLYEFLLLEGAQAGLSWSTILKKRRGYHRAFAGFDPVQVAAFDHSAIGRLLADAAIVRNRLKIEAAIANARVFLKVQERYGSFDAFAWRFVGGRPRRNAWRNLADVPALTPESTTMSREMRKLGFRFVGPTICYAFMQAVGMVNDHLVDCFRYREVNENPASAGL
jgi:DNA-3-methyladenine glycosylase I